MEKKCARCEKKTQELRRIKRRLRKLLDCVLHRTCLYVTAEDRGPVSHKLVTSQWVEVRDYLIRILEGDEKI